MRRKLQFLCLSLILIGLSACLERIDFARPDSIKNGIAIQGKLTKDNPSKVEVSIRKIFDFESNPRFLPAKSVHIIDENNKELELITRATGKYNLEIPNDHPFFKVEYEKGYKIRVVNADGRVFESHFDSIFPVPKPRKLRVKVTPVTVQGRAGIITQREQLSFFIDTPLSLPGNSSFSRILWEFDGVYQLTDFGSRITNSEPKTCYIYSPPVRNYITSNPKSLVIDSLGFKLYETSFTSLFAEGYYLEVLQQGLSEAAYDYWSQVNLVVNRTGDVFQEPAGKVNSNIKNIEDPTDEVFGYFYATEAEVIRVYVSPEMAKFPLSECTGSVANYCFDCLLLDRSTDIKPDWWVE